MSRAPAAALCQPIVGKRVLRQAGRIRYAVVAGAFACAVLPAPAAVEPQPSALPPVEAVRLIREARIARATNQPHKALLLLQQAERIGPSGPWMTWQLILAYQAEGKDVSELRDRLMGRAASLDASLLRWIIRS